MLLRPVEKIHIYVCVSQGSFVLPDFGRLSFGVDLSPDEEERMRLGIVEDIAGVSDEGNAFVKVRLFSRSHVKVQLRKVR